MENKKEKQKNYYNKGAKLLPMLNVGNTVIFKKNSKEWNYGIIVGNVNGKSYIIKDSFDRHFRRNRRFIAKTNNTEFNTSELLEEGVLTDKVVKNNNNLTKIQIVSPSEQAANINNEHGNDEVIETELSVNNDTSRSSLDEYNIADRNVSGSDSETEPELQSVNVPPIQSEFKTSRYGRVIRPAKMYGFEDQTNFNLWINFVY